MNYLGNIYKRNQLSLKVVKNEGDKIGVIPNISFELMILSTQNDNFSPMRIIWTTEKELKDKGFIKQ